jgi:flagellar motor switch protein FliG
MLKIHNMNKEEFENIINELGNLKNLPNSKLIEIMDKLTNDFDLTKNTIIGLTVYLDSVEELYNKTLKEYQNRT